MNDAELHHPLESAQTTEIAIALRRFREDAGKIVLPNVVRPIVRDRWVACQVYFPESSMGPVRSTRVEQDVDPRLQMNRRYVKVVRDHLKNQFIQLETLHLVALLCDADGFLLELFGATPLKHRLTQSGIQIGVNLSERYVGNTSSGTALTLNRPISFHGAEHFFEKFHPFSSSAVPISLHGGRDVIGSIALVALASQVPPYLPTLTESMRVAIGSQMELQTYRTEMRMVHLSIIGQLDCHVIVTDEHHQVVDQLHPLMLPPEAQSAMVNLTEMNERSDFEVVLGKRSYRADVRSLWDESGAYKGRLGLFRDVTQNRLLEHRVRGAEKVTLLNSLAAGIAHEIRNPLTTARGFLQLFMERMPDERDKRFLDLTIEELDRIQQLVTDFMTLAKPDKPDFGAVNVSQLLRTMRDFLSPEATLHDVILRTDIPPGDVWVHGDENQLKQIVLNIFQNAVQACGAGGIVAMRLVDSQDELDVVITDTGMGMTESQLLRLFQPFYTTKPAGTGLGLVVCKQMIERHGGRIDIKSTVGSGTTVQVSLPKLEHLPTGRAEAAISIEPSTNGTDS